MSAGSETRWATGQAWHAFTSRCALASCVAALIASGSAWASSRTIFGYDAQGRLVKSDERRTGGAGLFTTYEMDAASNRTKVQSGQGSGPILPWHGTLLAGQSLISTDARFRLAMQFDGNLVLYDQDGKPMWYTGISAGRGVRLEMQNDGNLVMYNSVAQPVWATNTAGNFNSNLIVQPDGNLVLYRSDGAVAWNSSTCCR